MDKSKLLKHHLDIERKLIHIMLKSKHAIEQLRERGVTPDWFDPAHQVMVDAAFNRYENGQFLLNAEGYRQILINLGQRLDIPKNMEEFAKCDISVYAVLDDLPTLTQQLVDGYAARTSAARLKEFTDAIETNGYYLASLRFAENVAADMSVITASTNDADFEYLSSSQLGGDDDDIKWIWAGYLAKGYITLLAGYPKSGKTTLESHVIKGMGTGSHNLGGIQPSKVLVVSEESRGLWRGRRDNLGYGENISFLLNPFNGQKSFGKWQQLITSIAAKVETENFDAVIIDPLLNFLPVTDENDAAKMMQALTCLEALKSAGAAVLLIHHMRKSQGDDGNAIRGSSALTGFCDINIELTKVDATGRKLRAYSRFDETPQETVANLTEDGYKIIGSVADYQQSERREKLLCILGDNDGLTIPEIRENWDDDALRPSVATLRRDLNDMWNQVGKEGSGIKGDPIKFFIIKETAV